MDAWGVAQRRQPLSLAADRGTIRGPPVGRGLAPARPGPAPGPARPRPGRPGPSGSKVWVRNFHKGNAGQLARHVGLHRTTQNIKTAIYGIPFLEFHGFPLFLEFLRNS